MAMPALTMTRIAPCDKEVVFSLALCCGYTVAVAGLIPASLGRLVLLEELVLSGNGFCGETIYSNDGTNCTLTSVTATLLILRRMFNNYFVSIFSHLDPP